LALIKCKHCGGDVSEKAAVCTHCGSKLIEESMAEEKETIFCEDCGNEIPKASTACPICGCPVSAKEKTEKKNPGFDFSIVKNKIDTKNKKIVCIVVIAAIIVAGFLVVNQNVLMGDDKIAYELVLDAADNFKDPSSVRLTGGTLGVDKDCLFCGISATNGYSARGTSYYFIMDGSILEEEDPTSFYTNKDYFNIEKINKKLEKALSSKY